MSLVLLLLLVSPSSSRKHNEPSEFLRSFLTRPGLLEETRGASGPRRPCRGGALCLDLVVDNWSFFRMAHSGHSVSPDALEAAFPPRDMAPQRRDFALRAKGEIGAGGQLSDRVEGVASWSLLENGMEMSRLSVAWKLNRRGGEGDRHQFAIALGDYIPRLDQMFVDKSGGGLESKAGRDTAARLAVADLRSTVAAKMERLGELHYKLTVSVVPQNMDIWYWVKCKEEMAVQAKAESENKVLNKVKQTSATKRGSQETKRITKEEEEGTPLYDRTDLLREGVTLNDLHDKGTSNLRDALRDKAKSHSVAIGIHVENWTRFKLGAPTVDINSGDLLEGGELMPPGQILPGRHDVTGVGSSGVLKGTSGVIRYPVGSESGGRVLHIMWSVPYSMQFYNAWAGVGLTAGGDPAPSYGDMYGKKDARRYARVKAGREFEFSDGTLIAMAFMDGGSSSKPVLRVRLIPRDDLDLAAGVRRRLGLPVSRGDDVAERRSAGDDEESSSPQVGRVTDNSGGREVRTTTLVAAATLLLPVALRGLLSC